MTKMQQKLQLPLQANCTHFSSVSMQESEIFMARPADRVMVQNWLGSNCFEKRLAIMTEISNHPLHTVNRFI